MPPPGDTSGAEQIVTWCQAFGVLEASCQRCHSDPTQNGAPFPLATYENTQAPYYTTEFVTHEKMLEAVASDFMPLVSIKLDPPVEPLTCEQKTTLLAWLEQGAKPEGGLNCLESDKTLLDCAAGGAGGASGSAGAGGSAK